MEKITAVILLGLVIHSFDLSLKCEYVFYLDVDNLTFN